MLRFKHRLQIGTRGHVHIYRNIHKYLLQFRYVSRAQKIMQILMQAHTIYGSLEHIFKDTPLSSVSSAITVKNWHSILTVCQNYQWCSPQHQSTISSRF